MRGTSNVIKRNVKKVRGVRYTLGARYLPKNMVFWTLHCLDVKMNIKELTTKPAPCLLMLSAAMYMITQKEITYSTNSE
jgi:hypothetical protein